MRLGVVADVHGNATALNAVLADAAPYEIDHWWALGDLVLHGPDPVEVLELLVDVLRAEFVKGNTDRYVVDGPQALAPAHHSEADVVGREFSRMLAQSVDWTRRRLDDAGWLAWLDRLPPSLRLGGQPGTRLLGVHASPKTDDGPGIDTDITSDDLAALFDGCEADVVVGGHTHLATDRLVGPVRALNPGATGLPRRSNGAGWLFIEHDDDSLTAEHHTVQFDTEPVVERLRKHRHPGADSAEGVLTRVHPFAS
jgi:predicted phosphodiesterase